MSDYVGQPPHGGYKITHHELCFEDCGHWDCMGCCYCPDEDDVATVEIMLATKEQSWLAMWFADQTQQAEQRGRQERLRELHQQPCRHYADGVQAARDAVAGLNAEHRPSDSSSACECFSCLLFGEALAAIDAIDALEKP